VKRLTLTTFVFALAALLAPVDVCVAGGPDQAPAPEKKAPLVAVRCGKLLTMDKNKTVINNGVILVRGTLIEAIGPASEVKIPEGCRVIDGSDYWVLPGLVDFHSHVGGDLGDLNDGVYLTNPDLRTTETLTPNNEYVKDARAAGVTSLLLIPGSGNNMAGFGTIVKTAGRTAEEITLKSPGCIKIAQAGNPERWWYRVGRFFMYWNLRTTLEEFREYHDAWCAYEEGKAEEKPAYDRIKEPFRDLFRQKYVAVMHTQGYQLMMTTVTQLWDALGIRTVMDHCTFDGYKTAPLMAERDVPIVAGPRNIWLDRHDRRVNGVPAKYYEAGVKILATNTDSPVLPIEEHFYQATIGVRMGWDDTYDALEGLTIIGAEAALTHDRVGSIEIGKDADIAFFTGDPLDPRSACMLTIVNGKVVYDAKKDGQRY